MIAGRLKPPAPINSEHDLLDFNSGEPVLDDWLKRLALKNSTGGASRCFVLCAENKVYYSLSAVAIAHELAPKAMRRNMPDPLPSLVLGRLAVDTRFHNQGIGSGLLRDALLRSLAIAQDAGVFAILAHPLYPRIYPRTTSPGKFCLSRGFLPSLLQHVTLLMT